MRYVNHRVRLNDVDRVGVLPVDLSTDLLVLMDSCNDSTALPWSHNPPTKQRHSTLSPFNITSLSLRCTPSNTLRIPHKILLHASNSIAPFRTQTTKLDQVSKIKKNKKKKNRKKRKRNSNSHGYREVRISFSSACSVLQKQDGKTKRTKNGMVGSKRFVGFLWLSLQRFLVIFERSNVAVVAVAVANRSTHKRELFKTKNHATPRGNKVKGVKGGWVEVTRARKKFACSCVLIKGVHWRLKKSYFFFVDI